MKARRSVLPTLTEVIEVDDARADVEPATLAPESMPMEPPLPHAAAAGGDLKTQVLDALRPRIDALLRERLREVIAADLSRLAEDTVRRVRGDLASAIRTLASEAVDEALARRRKS